MSSPHQLARLIDGVKAANDWSDVDLVRNAKEKGHELSKSNISRYRGPLVSIKGEIIRALAAGLKVKPSQVAIAAIESMGIALPAYDDITPEQAIELDVRLSARDKSVVLGVLRDLRAPAHSHASPEVDEDQEVTPPREGGALLDFTPPDVDDLGAAAQKGTSLGRRLRDAQDRDVETPEN